MSACLKKHGFAVGRPSTGSFLIERVFANH